MFGKALGPMAPPDIDRKKLDEIRQNALRSVANSSNPVLAEAAREIQAGRLTLREAVVNPGYREAFAVAADNLMNSLRDKGIDEFRKEAEENPEAVLAQPGPPQKPENPQVDDECFNGPIMQTPSSTDHRGQDGTPPKRARWNRRT